MQVKRLLPVILLVALSACCISSVFGQLDPSTLTPPPAAVALPGITVKWDRVEDDFRDDFFGYLLYWKIGPSGSSPYTGDPLIIGHPLYVPPSPIPILIDEEVRSGNSSYLSGTSEYPEFRFLDLVSNQPDEYYWAVVTAAIWKFKTYWKPTPTAQDPASGVTVTEADKTSYWDPDIGLSGDTVYNIGEESEFSNEVNWQVRDEEPILVFPPEITGITVFQYKP